MNILLILVALITVSQRKPFIYGSYFDDIEKCSVTQNGEEYIGKVSVTKTGKECKMWYQAIEGRENLKETYFSDKSFNMSMNYCRNPNSISSGPWCIYGDEINEWETCDIPHCEQRDGCKDTMFGQEYDGFINVTSQGNPCNAWANQNVFKESDFPESSFNEIGNKCRNPGKKTGPWCFTTSTTEVFEYCNVSKCIKRVNQAEYFLGQNHLESISDFIVEIDMNELIVNITVKILIPKKLWTSNVQKKISVWTSKYTHICQRDLNYYDYCHAEHTDSKSDNMVLLFICKVSLLSVIIIVPLDSEQYKYEFMKGSPYTFNNELSLKAQNYLKQVVRKSNLNNFTIPLPDNGGSFFLLGDNTIPYAVSTDNMVVITISKVGKGRIGLMGNEYFTDRSYAPKLQDLFERVYGSHKGMPIYLSRNYLKSLRTLWKKKVPFKDPVIWNAHEKIKKRNVKLLLKMVRDGLNIIIGLKPWAYHFYVNKLQDSELKDLLLLAGVWPSLDLTYGNLKIITSLEIKLLPLVHLLDYANSNITSAISVSKLIVDSLSNTPFSEITEKPSNGILIEELRVSMAKVTLSYNDIMKSYVPCNRKPLINNRKKIILEMFNMILLNTLDNNFTAAGINLYPGIVNSKVIPQESVRIKLQIKYIKEKIYLGLFLPASQRSIVSLSTIKSKTCSLFINFHLFDISKKKKWNKWPKTMNSFVIESNSTRSFQTSFGGLIALSCETSNDDVEVKLSNVVRVPMYDRRTGLVDEMWSKLKDRGAPWAILAGDSIVFIVPAIAIRNMANPKLMMELWDKMIKEEFHLRGRSLLKTYRELVSADIQIEAGYMHAGYPIGTLIQHVANPAIKVKFLFAQKQINKNGYWGLVHEVGHNLQHDIFTFLGTEEVTNNIFTLVAVERISNFSSWNPEQGWLSEDKLPNIVKHINDRIFSFWQNEPYVGLGIYAQLRAEFGWEFYRQLFRRYDKLIVEYGQKVTSMKNEEKIQLWIVESSKIVQMNLVPLYDYWAWPITEETKNSLDKYPFFLPDDFLTKMTTNKVKEILAKYEDEKIVSRTPLPLSVIIGPLEDPLMIEGDQIIKEIILI